MRYTYFLVILGLAMVSCQAPSEATNEVTPAPLYDYDVEEKIAEMGLILKEPSPRIQGKR